MYKENIVGLVFGELTCIGPTNGANYLFRCSCGGEREANGTRVKKGEIKRCKQCSLKLKGEVGKRREIPLVGKVFGQLTCLEKLPKTSSGNSRYLLICSCGQEHIAGSHNLRKGISTRCRKCADRKMANANSKQWGGCGLISGGWWYTHITTRSGMWRGRRGTPIQIAIDVKYGWELYTKQGGNCAISGVEIGFPKTNKPSDKSMGTASLDRINPSMGDVEGNVQWVHKIINQMKWNNSDEELIKWCKTVTVYQKRKNGNM